MFVRRYYMYIGEDVHMCVYIMWAYLGVKFVSEKFNPKVHNDSKETQSRGTPTIGKFNTLKETSVKQKAFKMVVEHWYLKKTFYVSSVKAYISDDSRPNLPQAPEVVMTEDNPSQSVESWLLQRLETIVLQYFDLMKI